jgi:hypothetical protein
MSLRGCLTILAIPVLVWASWTIYTWPETHRYRYTVEVDTPDGLRVGTTVIEDISRKQPRLLPDMSRYSVITRGEAVAVHIPGKQTLFAILKQDGGLSFGHITYLALGPKGSPERQPGAPPVLMKVHVGGKETGIREQEGIPMLVRFRNINDPNSVEKVDPDNLAASFGQGYRLRKVAVQATNDPVTIGVLDHFSWWKEYTGKLLDGTCCLELAAAKNLSAHLGLLQFSTLSDDKYYTSRHPNPQPIR